MPITNQDTKQNPKKDSFTLWQAVAMIVLTVVISAGGWYVIGQQFFWTGMDQKRIEQQVTYLEKKSKENPKDTQTRVELAFNYHLVGKNSDAIRILSQVIETDKKNFNAYYNMGIIYLDEKRYDDSLDMFQRCIELSPKDYKGYMLKGVAYRQLKMYKDALDVLKKASKLAPAQADVIYEVGLVVEAQGDKVGAAKIYKEALTYDPLYKDAAEALKRVQ